MKEKKTYNTTGKSNSQITVDRPSFFKMKAIAAVRGQSKNEALEEAIQLYNEVHKEVLS
jgi:hypothetical protein